MIDRALLRRLLGVSAILLFLSVGAALAIWRSPALAGGLALGFTLGLTPFLSWGWIADRGLSSRRARILAALLLLGKLGLYAGALYLFVTRSIVSPVGVLIGITAVVAVYAVGSALQPPTRPKEAA